MTLSPAAALAIYCLSLNAYHEARGEGRAEMVRVSHVVLNRVDSQNYPDTTCEVVYQPRQFSWTGDAIPDRPTDPVAWKAAQMAALEAWMAPDTTKGALWYYAHKKVTPDWARVRRVVMRTDGHTFLVE